MKIFPMMMILSVLAVTACGKKKDKKDTTPPSSEDQIGQVTNQPSNNDQAGQGADTPAPISTKQSSELTLEPSKPQFYVIDVPGATNLNIVIGAKAAGTYTLTAELFNADCKASSGQGKTSVSGGSSGTISAPNNVCLKVSADNSTPIQFTFTVQ